MRTRVYKGRVLAPSVVGIATYRPLGMQKAPDSISGLSIHKAVLHPFFDEQPNIAIVN